MSLRTMRKLALFGVGLYVGLRAEDWLCRLAVPKRALRGLASAAVGHGVPSSNGHGTHLGLLPGRK